MVERAEAGELRRTERPESAVDLAALVAEASENGESLRIQGGRTHERFGNVCREDARLVDTTGLDGIIDYSPVDLTLAVESGVRLAQIDALLAEHGQRLALDAPLRDRATIGGTFASGLSGPRRLRYGALKDMVIGAEVVNNRGEITKSGGMVVKNVSGYEVARLHYGAHGAYGIISRLNLKVLPVAESRVEARPIYRSAADCLSAASSILVSSLDPAAVYVTHPSPAQWMLHVQIEGNRRFAMLQREKVIERVAGIVKPIGVDSADLDGNSTPDFDLIANLAADEDVLVVRLSVPASDKADTLQHIAFAGDTEILADAGSGLIYVREQASNDVLGRLQALGKPMTVLAAPEGLKSGMDVFGEIDQAPASLLERLKNEYDPGRMFNPGVFVRHL